MAWLSALDARLFTQPHLFGSHAALADMAIAPFVRQFAGIDADWWAAQPWPHLQAWLAQWQAAPLLASVMHKLPAWVDGTEGVRFPHPQGIWAPEGCDGNPTAPLLGGQVERRVRSR
jgi:hypothetical protein